MHEVIICFSLEEVFIPTKHICGLSLSVKSHSSSKK
jgi:hypothetical protein